MTDIARLRRLLAEASPGPWAAGDNGLTVDAEPWCVVSPEPQGRGIPLVSCAGRRAVATAALIEQMHEDLPGLLDEVERLTKELAAKVQELQEQIDRMGTTFIGILTGGCCERHARRERSL